MRNIIQHNDLSQPVYERLKEMIANGSLPPGQKLIQEKLATELGVSRTPLLKALQTLEHEMLVESIPRRGVYVRQISTQEMIDVYDCREAVESMAIRLVIERASDIEVLKIKKVFEPFVNKVSIDMKKYRKADERFHDMIIDLSKNPVLKRMSQLSDIHKRVYQYGLIRPPEETLIEHMNIADALLKRDIELADRELRNHIGLSRHELNQKK
ncbi:MAG: GntR family transcriptional regulator [Cyclobacteriaceae bacterium]